MSMNIKTEGKATTLTTPKTCKGCGICCHLDLPLHSDAEEELFKSSSKVYVSSDSVAYIHPFACPFFDTANRLCRVYDKRPEVCRRFERGSDACIRSLTHVLILSIVEKELLAATPVFC
jgi:Fe-S-cluster containining protein